MSRHWPRGRHREHRPTGAPPLAADPPAAAGPQLASIGITLATALKRLLGVAVNAAFGDATDIWEAGLATDSAVFHCDENTRDHSRGDHGFFCLAIGIAKPFPLRIGS